MVPWHKHPHLRPWSLVDTDSDDDFYFSCADSGCTTCCIDLDTLDEQRRPARDDARRPRSRNDHRTSA